MDFYNAALYRSVAEILADTPAITLGRGTRYPWAAMPTGFGQIVRTDYAEAIGGGAAALGPDVLEFGRITFDCHLNAASPNDVEWLRDDLAAAWAPLAVDVGGLRVGFADQERFYRGRPGSIDISFADMKSGMGRARLTYSLLDPLWYERGPVDGFFTAMVQAGSGGTGGLSFPDASPFTFASGSQAVSPDVDVVNGGSAPAHWTGRLNGPLATPTLLLDGVGITFNGTIPAGSQLTVNSRDRSVALDGASRSTWPTLASTWWTIGPGTHTFGLRAATGNGTATLIWQNANY